MRKDSVLEPSCFLGPEECWREFGCAIVKQAAFDWKDAVKKLKKYDSHELEEQKRSAEKFLQSKLCGLYADINGKELLRKMKERVA